MYLSSFRVGNCPDRLIELARGGTRAAVIANAMDAAPSEIRTDGVTRELNALTALGLVAEELDLRDHFGTRGAVGSELRRYDIVWLRGGNVFMLRYALARSDADVELTRLLDKDALVYSGYSAGPCVLAPTLRGLETVDSPVVVEQLYGDHPIWEGLGVIDYSIWSPSNIGGSESLTRRFATERSSSSTARHSSSAAKERPLPGPIPDQKRATRDRQSCELLPYGDVAAAIARERFSVPAAPPFMEPHSGEASHEV
jgi:dipeptidase E